MSAAQHVDLLRDVTVGKLPTTNSGLSATSDAKDDDGVSLDSGIDHEDLSGRLFDDRAGDLAGQRVLSALGAEAQNGVALAGPRTSSIDSHAGAVQR